MSILTYWPYPAEDTKNFVADMAQTLRTRYNSCSRMAHGEIHAGTTHASLVTYQIDSDNDQKVIAFTRAGKVYCLIASYNHSDEYAFHTLLRKVVSSWTF